MDADTQIQLARERLRQLQVERDEDEIYDEQIAKDLETIKDKHSFTVIIPSVKLEQDVILSETTRVQLKETPSARVFVEGHTDSSAVNYPVVDFKVNCTVYDDNFTLSAAQAREARKLLISNVDSVIAKKYIVAGYGDSQPIEGLAPTDGKNRRVEIRIVAQPVS